MNLFLEVDKDFESNFDIVLKKSLFFFQEKVQRLS